MEEKEIIEKAEYCLNCKNKPCVSGCPLGNDIPRFISHIKKREYEEAYKVLLDTTIMQPICGRICPKDTQCESKCVRGLKAEPVKIGELEAFVGDYYINNLKEYINIKGKKNKKVAIIGAGPCGISCGVELIKKGYDVTIYEKYDKIGGILSHGIPDFRLDSKVLNKWIQNILNIGVKIEYNKELGVDITLEELEKTYDAIFLSFGANIGTTINILGEQLEGVYSGNELLEKKIYPDYKEKKVAIIGGGNVALDCAETIKKLGAKEVKILYRRSKQEMPAEKKEIEHAIKNGIEIIYQTNIVKIIGEKKVEKVECIKTKLVQKEQESRKIPVDIQGTNYILGVDYIIKAIGAKADQKLLSKLDIKLDSYGYIKTDENQMTSKEKIFAGGDLVNGSSTIAYVSKKGRDAANKIDQYLKK